MFESIMRFFKKMGKKEEKPTNSKDAAKERLHLVLMQDRANVSADFLELMKQEIIEVIKKYIDIDEKAIDVRLTNKENEDGTNGAPALYANIPILNIKNDARKMEAKDSSKAQEKTEKKETPKVENKKENKKEDKKEEKIEDKKEEKENLEEVIINEPEENKEENKNENKQEIKDENKKKEVEEKKQDSNAENQEKNEQDEKNSKDEVESKN